MKASKKLYTLLSLVVTAALLLVVSSNIQAIEDWWKLRGYTPTTQAQQLADADTMTDKARRLFYVNHPELITSKEVFRKTCTQNEQTIVLGCYHPINDGIAVYDVPDARLAGIEEVTAAHEMLHAAYDRLSDSERTRVNGLLQTYYASGLNDARISKTIDAYKKFEPNDVVNEMHSIFGTEVINLPAELENYYKQYFNDRGRVISFSNQYEAVFTANEQQRDNIKNQIDTLKSQLETDRKNIKSEQDYLVSENGRMQQLLAENRTDEYNQAVNPYNARVNRYRELVSSYNAKISKINELVNQYNNLAYEQEDLYKSLDTRVPTSNTQ